MKKHYKVVVYYYDEEIALETRAETEGEARKNFAYQIAKMGIKFYMAYAMLAAANITIVVDFNKKPTTILIDGCGRKRHLTDGGFFDPCDEDGYEDEDDE